MPVPKRKTSKSRRDQRSACKFLVPQLFATCAHCSAPLLPHIVCETCGYYKGRKIMKTKLDRAIKRGQTRQKAHTAQAEAAQTPPGDQA